MRSERAKLPTLSCATPQPSARCTIETSSDSPERAVIAADAVELARGDIERDRDVGPGLEARVGDRADQLGEAFLVRLESRPVAAFVGHALQRAALREPRAGGGVDLRGPLERF